MNVIVNWSGGPDSTAALQYLLQNTNYRVTALYADGDVSTEMANIVEEEAVDKLYPIMLERFRLFKLLKVRHVRSSKFALFCAEANVYPVFLSLDGSYSKLFIGRCKEENVEQIRTGTSVNAWFWDRQRKIFDASNIELVELNTEWTKREIKQKLGDLWDMTVSCQYPRSDKTSCRNCAKCKERNKLKPRRKY